MAEKLSARALILNQLPFENGHHSPAYSGVMHAVGEAGWGLLALGNYEFGKTTMARQLYSYGRQDERRVSESYAALILSGTSFPRLRDQWPGIDAFGEAARGIIPVALVHAELLPVGLELGPHDIAISAEPLGKLEPTLTAWLGQATLLLAKRYPAPSF